MAVVTRACIQKHSEFTYGVHPSFIEELLGLNVCRIGMQKGEVVDILKQLEHGAMGARRALIAKLDLLRQAIGYGLTYRVVLVDGVRQLQFAVYKRNKLSNEGQLSMMLSLGVGGHVEHKDFEDHLLSDNGDLDNTGVMDLYETIDYSFLREYVEEIKVLLGQLIIGTQLINSRRPVGFVHDTLPDKPGYVGNHHFGVVYVVEAPADATFEMSEELNDAVCWAGVKDLEMHLKNGDQIDGPTYAQFEVWSKMIIENIKPLEELLLA